MENCNQFVKPISSFCYQQCRNNTKEIRCNTIKKNVQNIFNTSKHFVIVKKKFKLISKETSYIRPEKNSWNQFHEFFWMFSFQKMEKIQNKFHEIDSFYFTSFGNPSFLPGLFKNFWPSVRHQYYYMNMNIKNKNSLNY